MEIYQQYKLWLSERQIFILKKHLPTVQVQKPFKWYEFWKQEYTFIEVLIINMIGVIINLWL